MIALFCLFLTLSVSPFKSKSRLEAENAALRHQLIVLQRRVRGRVQRRRRWSRAEKERIVAAAMEPAVSAAFLAALILIGIGSAAVWGTVVGAVLISAW